MTSTYDLDAVIAERRTTAREPFRFTFGGQTFELPADVDVRVATAVDRRDFDEALRRLLGPADYARLEAVDEVLTLSTLMALLDAWTDYLGTDVGESPASASS